MLRIVTTMNISYGSTTLNGNSRNKRNYPIDPMETTRPMEKPQRIEAMLLLMLSYTVSFKMASLFMPMDRSTPSSYCESLMFAYMVTTS